MFFLNRVWNFSLGMSRDALAATFFLFFTELLATFLMLLCLRNPIATLLTLLSYTLFGCFATMQLCLQCL